MCEPSSIIAGIGAIIGAATSIGTTAYSNKQQKKAERRQREAEAEAHKRSLQQKESVAKTAQTPTVNDDLKKRSLSSLKTTTSKNKTSTVNVSDTGTGLNIPM